MTTNDNITMDTLAEITGLDPEWLKTVIMIQIQAD